MLKLNLFIFSLNVIFLGCKTRNLNESNSKSVNTKVDEEGKFQSVLAFGSYYLIVVPFVKTGKWVFSLSLRPASFC